MKIKLSLTLLTLFFLSLSSVQAGTISKPPYLLTLNSGLVGHWTFDGANITNGRINDISGQGNHGNTVSIATSTFYTVGKIGQGVNFDGVNDYVSKVVTNSSVLLYKDGNLTTRSVSFWVKGGDQTLRCIYCEGSSGSFNSVFEISSHASGDPVGTLSVWLRNDAAASPIDQKKSIGVGLDNTWHHIVWTDNNGTAKLYIDGVQDSQNFTYTPSGAYTLDRSSIGAQSKGGVRFFNGSVDDMRAYNRVLTATEITSLYSFGASKLGVTKTPTGLQSGLVGHWTFDGKDMSGGVARDISGNANNGNMSGISTSTFYTLGKIGQGVQFDGVNDYVNVGTLGSFGASNGQTQMQQGSTVSMWVKTTNTTDVMTVIGNSNALTTLPGFGISLNRGPFGMVNGNIRVSWTQTSNWGSTYTADATGINDGNWHHIVAVTVLTGTQQIWVDGQSKAVGSTRDLFSVFQSWSISPGLGIGAEINAGGTAQDYFRGSMDDVRVYNRTLSAAEIAELYSLGASKLGVTKTPTGLRSGLVGHWTFDGKDMSGGVARDISGQGNNGKLTNIATSTFYAMGKIGQGLNFDGVDDQVTFGIVSGGTFSMSAWIKTRGSPNSVCPVSVDAIQGLCTYSGGGYAIALVVNGSYFAGAIAATPIYDGNWHHVVGTQTGSDTRIYVDGVLSGTAATTANVTASLFRAGTDVGLFNTSFNGSIDDVRRYDRVLTPSEVLQLYNAGR